MLLNPQDVIAVVDLLYRGEMTPSERQSYLAETVEESIEPERSLLTALGRHVLDDLIDMAAMEWWVEQARARGLDASKVLDLSRALVEHLRTAGRLLPAELTELAGLARRQRDVEVPK